jgi:hypothetical protein
MRSQTKDGRYSVRGLKVAGSVFSWWAKAEERSVSTVELVFRDQAGSSCIFWLLVLAPSKN